MDKISGLAQHPRAHGEVVVISSIRSKLPPAENAVPAPCTTATRTSGSRSTRGPHVGQVAVGVGPDGVEPGPVERDAQHSVGGLVEAQARELVA